MFLSLIIVVLFSSALIVSSIAVVSSMNPVFSILFLVLCFFNVSGILLVSGLEFIPISFIVIYVGAIAILFLFIIMMLNIKYNELQQMTTKTFLPLLFLILIILAFECLFMFNPNDSVASLQNDEIGFLAEFSSSVDNIISFIELCFKLSNISSLGNVIFIDYVYHLIISGLILLVAMVAAITLTLNKQFITKAQVVYLQILTDHDAVLSKYK